MYFYYQRIRRGDISWLPHTANSVILVHGLDAVDYVRINISYPCGLTDKPAHRKLHPALASILFRLQCSTTALLK